MNLSKNYQKLLLTFFISIIGGAVFSILHIPLPWVLGPMSFVLMGSTRWQHLFLWSKSLQNTGLIIVAYTMGLSFTAAALSEIARHLPTMLLLTVILVVLSIALAVVMNRLTKAGFMTMLMGTVPGGLNQVVMLAEETKGVNVTVVTVMQVMRLMTIIVTVPLLLFSPVIGETHHNVVQSMIGVAEPAGGWGSVTDYLIFAAVCMLCAWIAQRLKLPTAPLLGPLFGTAVLQISGMTGPELPPIILIGAQICIGAYLGLLLKPSEFTNRIRTLSLALASSLLLVIGTFAQSWILSNNDPMSLSTAVLSLAPGGMDQMSLIAHEIDADISIVVVYQLFRLLFMFFIVLPLLKVVIDRYNKRQPH
ncbi:AbrB family transcriptional regulator [Paenibacillus sp. strain BS8-2]